MKYLAPIIVLSALFLAVTSLWNDSFIVDEIPHVGAGYSYVVKGDYRLNPEHPPLAKDAAGLALSLLPVNQSAFNTKFWTDDVNGQWNFGRNLIYNSGNNADLITRVAKLPMLLFFLLAAFMVHKWSKKMYGPKTAVLALFLFSFSPTVIAHSRFVTTDMAALFGILFASYFFIEFLKKQKTTNMWLSGLFFGIALLCKFSAVLLVPFFLILAVLKRPILKNLTRTILIFIIGTVFIVWPVYALHVQNYPPEKQKFDTQTILGDIYGTNIKASTKIVLDSVIWASDKTLTRPFAQYALGLLRVTHQTSEPHDIYFRGEIYKYGVRSYFPTVYLIKEPLVWWMLVLAAVLFLGFSVKKQRPKNDIIRKMLRDHFTETAMLLWLAIYWTTSIRGTLNIGVRHLLPVYPFAIILVSGQMFGIGREAQKRGRKLFLAFACFLTAVLGWYMFENLRVYPYYLSYFNQIAGGPSGGYRFVADSNLDWGQDLKRLSKYVEEQGINKIELDYFGWADQQWYLGNKFVYVSSKTYRNLENFKQRNGSNGWIAVSATFLTGSYQGNLDDYAWLRAIPPTAVIGNSIFVWHIK